jgi:predicted outer membrane repeat protein
VNRFLRKSPGRLNLLLVSTLVLCTTGLIPLENPLPATESWYVGPSGDDSDDCQSPESACATINGALAKPGFTSGDTVFVQTGGYTGSGPFVVTLTKNAFLSGGWNSAFSAQDGFSTVDGQSARAGMLVDTGLIVQIERFEIMNGHSTYGPGGGIVNRGDLTVTDCEISYGGAFTGAGIENYGKLALADSTVSHNTAGSFGGGVENLGILNVSSSVIEYNSGGDGGGIYNLFASLSLHNAVVAGNTASGSGGGIYNQGSMEIEDSTIRGNSAYSAGGISNRKDATIVKSTISDNVATVWYGGGIFNDVLVSLSISNSTISGNQALAFQGGGIFNFGAASLTNATITANRAGAAGGIDHQGSSLTAVNSIIADNTASVAPNCGGNITSLGHNLSSDSACQFDKTGDLQNTDPLLGPLADNGGPTNTHALGAGSPAIDAGDDSVCGSSDQRGWSRSVDGDGDGSAICDIGAYEYGAIPTAFTLYLPLILR